uniref:SFRICE_021131 n=1 Tax=Spodoptera frugiperda TaxID=7108 RepID=A0A2H1VUF0_SPOFR
MKYLGLILGSPWNFVDNFRSLASKLKRMGAALERLLSNLGGPDASCRRLSMAVYGAPVCSPNLMQQSVRVLLTSQRVYTDYTDDAWWRWSQPRAASDRLPQCWLDDIVDEPQR